MARAGIKTICYNFMAITDWTRTDLMWKLPNGGYALRFDMVDFCAYDVLILKRRNAEADHPAERIAAASLRLAAWPESKIAELERNLIDWVPARETIYDRPSFLRQLDEYRDLTVEGLRQNLFPFVRRDRTSRGRSGRTAGDPSRRSPLPAVRPAARQLDRRGYAQASRRRRYPCQWRDAMHRLLRRQCPSNDLVAMAREFAPRIHFAHLRNTTREPDGSFYEAEHLDGDTDMVGVVAALLDVEKEQQRTIPMRPDHGHLIVDDIGKTVNPGYSCIGRLKGLAELRGVMRTVAAFRAGAVH